MENKKSYYAIIPADVRYNENLSANAKLLYGEITALCNEKGYCWSNNRYFSDLYQTTERTVQRWLMGLTKENFIKIEDGDSQKRKIFINGHDKNVIVTPTKMSGQPRQKCHGNHDKNVVYNNTVNNTTNNTEKSASFLNDLPIEVMEEFKQKFNVSERQLKSKAEDLFNYCESHGKRYKNYKAFLKNAVKKDFGERLPDDQAKIEAIKATQAKYQGSSGFANQLKDKFKIK